MSRSKYFQLLVSKLPKTLSNQFIEQLESKCEIIELDKNEPLISFQSSDRKIYFVVEGSFIRKIISSKGEEKTVMFHTESFCEFFKSYDSVYFHTKTNYEIKANEKSVVVAVGFDFLYEHIQTEMSMMQFYLKKTEELFVILDLFRNFHLGLTSEDYLNWLYQNYRFLFQRFPSQNIASFMGITPVWLSKLKAKFIS